MRNLFVPDILRTVFIYQHIPFVGELIHVNQLKNRTLAGAGRPDEIDKLAIPNFDVDAIQTVADAKFSIGLGFLAPEEGALARALFSSVDVFSIWSYVLIVMGLMYVFEMARRQAIYCIIPLWLLQVLFLFIGEVTGGMG